MAHRAYSDFAHLRDNQLLNFVLSLGNDGGSGEESAAAKARNKKKEDDAKKLAKLSNMRNENGEKISQEQKQQIIRMIQRLQEMQELAFEERNQLSEAVTILSKQLQKLNEKLGALERENAQGEALGQSLRDEIEAGTEKQRMCVKRPNARTRAARRARPESEVPPPPLDAFPRYTQQCEELSRESEELRHTTMVRTDLLLHKKRQEVRDVEREYKNALMGGGKQSGVGCDTPLPPLTPIEPIQLDPAAGKPAPCDATGARKYKSLVNQGNLDVMEIEKAYSPTSWAPSRSPGGRRDDGSSFDDGRSFGGSTITSMFSKAGLSPTSRASPGAPRSPSTGSLPPAASPTRSMRSSPTKGARPK